LLFSKHFLTAPEKERLVSDPQRAGNRRAQEYPVRGAKNEFGASLLKSRCKKGRRIAGLV